MVLNNSGTVNVQAGTLRLDGGGTDTGTYAVSSGTTLQFGGGTRALNAGSISNSGTLANTGATTNFSGTYTETGGSISVSAGAFNVNSALSSASLTLSGGTLGGSNAFTLASGGTATLGNGTLTINTFNVSSGATANLSNTGFAPPFFQPATFNNSGVVNWSGTQGLRTASAATTFNNLSGAQFNIQNAQGWDTCCSGGSVVFNNQAGATLTKSSVGTSTLSSGVVLNNSGTVNVSAGTLRLDGGGASSGRVTVGAGGTLVAGSTAILVNVNGGTHNIANSAGQAIYDLMGSTTASETIEGNNLTLGTDRPLRGSGVCPSCPIPAELLTASGATVNTQQAVKVDTALLEATAPLINMINSSQMTSNGDLINLANQAKLVGTLPGDALIKLNASTLNVTGSLFNVAGGSYLNVTSGSLFSLNTGSTLNINSGYLVNISGGSVFSLASGGSFGLFGATGTNTLNITNNTALCGGCSIVTNIPNLTGVKVLLGNGVSASQITVAPTFTAFAGPGTANVNVSGTSGAVLAVSGTSKVKLGF